MVIHSYLDLKKTLMHYKVIVTAAVVVVIIFVFVAVVKNAIHYATSEHDGCFENGWAFILDFKNYTTIDSSEKGVVLIFVVVVVVVQRL